MVTIHTTYFNKISSTSPMQRFRGFVWLLNYTSALLVWLLNYIAAVFVWLLNYIAAVFVWLLNYIAAVPINSSNSTAIVMWARYVFSEVGIEIFNTLINLQLLKCYLKHIWTFTNYQSPVLEVDFPLHIITEWLCSCSHSFLWKGFFLRIW
jgi:hypothetical protein